LIKIGDYVFDKNKQEIVQILDINELWGYITYKVFNPATGEVYKVNEKEITKEMPESKHDENYLRYVAILSRIKNEKNEGILAPLSSNIIPLPHQLYVLNRALSNNNIRYILADEVGLGKTIEAGLIIKELKTRGLIKRILIVCPTGLITQWTIEMQEKFNEKFHVILPEDYDTIRKLTGKDDVYSQFDQVISPMDSIKPLEKRTGWTEEMIKEYNDERIYSIINSGWDLVVIDEAHRVAGSSSEVARYKLGKLLASSCPYLLLLTATPHNGKTEPFYRLIKLVDEKAFPNVNAVVKEQVAPYIIRTEKREAIDYNGNKLFKNRITKTIELYWDERHSLQRKLYKMVSHYVARNYNKALRNRNKNMWLIFLLIMMQRLVTSSTQAIRESMERRLKVLENQDFQFQTMLENIMTEMDLEENLEQAITTISLDIQEEINQINEIIAIAKQAEYQYLDIKVEPLLEILDNLFLEDQNLKVIIFTEFVATQEYLVRILNQFGYSTSILNGSMSIDERNAALKEFKENTNILISTDAGGEGINLQFSNVVINYDLPWNPMKIEQRIGRVDRIGQERDVLVYNFVLADTVEKRVRDVLERKLYVILQEIGIDKYSDILDSETAELNFTEAYLKSIYNPNDIETNLQPIEEDLKKQIKQALNIKELIKDEKDLTSVIGKTHTFNFELALKHMISYYEKYKGNIELSIDQYDINNPIIVEHLHRDIVQDLYNNILDVSIENFTYEKGYFMLWQVEVTSNDRDKKIIPIFINNDFILRPIAGKKIWDALIDNNKIINVNKGSKIDKSIFDKLIELSMEFAYETFIKLKDEHEKRNEETYRKYMYALNLRLEAAQNIGIEYIKKHKIKTLLKEREEIEISYQNSKNIYPDLKLILLVRME